MSAYNPRLPWDTVLREAADSQAFWYKELMEPALLYERASGATAIPAHRVLDEAPPSDRPRPPPPNRYRPNATGAAKKKVAAKQKQEICFQFNRNANGCKDPCPNQRQYVCEGCKTLGVRVIECSCGLGPTTKKQKGGGRGKGK